MNDVTFEVGAYNNNGKVERKFINLSKAVHVAIGGATGSGKSVLLHEIIASVDAPVVLIDCKGGLEFDRWTPNSKIVNHKCYSNIDDIITILKGLTNELEKRCDILKKQKMRDYREYDDSKTMPPIAIVIDEVQEIMRDRKAKPLLISLVKRGRALGIHVIVATQTPSKAILKDIKDNIGCGISLKVNTPEASRLLIGDDRAHNITEIGGLYVRELNDGDKVTYCKSLLTNFEKIGI